MNTYRFNFSTNSVLYINSKGELKRMYCPFEVVAKITLAEIKAGDIVIVEAVKITPEGKDVYIIDGKGFYVLYFSLT